MNAEELDIARRLVACKGWVWLPGMNILDMAILRSGPTELSALLAALEAAP